MPPRELSRVLVLTSAELPTRLGADTTVGTVGLVYPVLDELLLGESVSRIMSTNLTKD